MLASSPSSTSDPGLGIELAVDDLRAAADRQQAIDTIGRHRKRADGDQFHLGAVVPAETRKPDLRPLLAAARSVGGQLKPGYILVVESTVYPGATEEECVPVMVGIRACMRPTGPTCCAISTACRRECGCGARDAAGPRVVV